MAVPISGCCTDMNWLSGIILLVRSALKEDEPDSPVM